MAGDAGNGWRTGNDPFLRVIRVLATVALLAATIYLMVDPDRHVDALPVIGIGIVSVMTLLGYPGAIPGPWGGRKDDR